jgi:pseudouridine kinase
LTSVPLADTTGGMASPEVICIGGATLDRKCRMLGPLLPGTSNPVTGSRAFGGVARNVSENLARLGLRVALATVVGDDDAGRDLVKHLAGIGIDTHPVIAKSAQRTAEYTAVLNADGSLAFGLADMAVLDAFSPSDIARLEPEFDQASWVFTDCNLPALTLAHLISMARTNGFRLAADAVSVAKAERLPRDLTGISLLFLNRDEAAAILGESLDPTDAAQALRERGAAMVVLTDGANGLVATDQTGVRKVPAHTAPVKDVTGAGDALIAAVLAGLIAGEALAEAAHVGVYVAAQTVASAATVCDDLTPDTLSRIRRISA